MRYHGGKTRLGKAISRIIINTIHQCGFEINGYVEPFCGMCGVLTHVVQSSNLPRYLASDSNESVVKMWTSIRDGWRPEIETFNEERFNYLKGNGESSAEKGFFGHAMTFGALYFQCYREDLRRLLDYSMRDVIKRSLSLKDVEFSFGDYIQFVSGVMDNSVIYCDPPYERRSRYYDESNKIIEFDSETFWSVCVQMSRSNIVLISENISFFEKKMGAYTGKSRVINLPGHSNRFGKTCRDSGEFICIMTHLDVALDEIII